MNHAPVHTAGEPASPEAANELAHLDTTFRSLFDHPVMVGPHVADACIKRYGRLPANCEVYVVESLPARDMPSVGDLLSDVAKRLRADLKRDAANAWLFRERGAQWKRERGRR